MKSEAKSKNKFSFLFSQDEIRVQLQAVITILYYTAAVIVKENDEIFFFFFIDRENIIHNNMYIVDKPYDIIIGLSSSRKIINRILLFWPEKKNIISKKPAIAK